MSFSKADACFNGTNLHRDLNAPVALEMASLLSTPGQSKDVLRAAQLLHFAAAKSLLGASDALGALQTRTDQLTSEGNPLTFGQIWETYTRAVEHGDCIAAAQIAHWYQIGVSEKLPQSNALCAHWLHHAHETGNKSSAIFLGIHVLADKFPENSPPCSKASALLGLRDAVQSGLATPADLAQPIAPLALARGLAALAMAHEEGLYLQRDLLRAHAYRVLAAQHGIQGSMLHAERLYSALPSDEQRQRADTLTEALVEMGASMLHAAAALYATPPSVGGGGGADSSAAESAETTGATEEPDSEFCFHLLTLAAQRGHADALFRCGFSLHKGAYGSHALQQDSARGYGMMGQAAEQGHTLAARTCGNMASHGIGVPRDVQAGAAWYALAASGGGGGAVKAAIRALRESAAAEKAAQTSISGDAATYVEIAAVGTALAALSRLAEEPSSTACCELVQYYDRLAPNYEPPLQPRGGARQAGKQAVRYLTLAARAGEDRCAAVAARRLIRGEGVSPDGQAAEQLLLGASANGHDQSLRALYAAYSHQLYGDLIPASNQSLQRLMQVAFDAASGDVLMLIGQAFNSGTPHIEEDESQALCAFEFALQLGQGGAAEAMFPLLLCGGAGRQPDKGAALDILQRGHAAGNDVCAEWLAECLWSALLGEHDPGASVAMWREQAEAGVTLSAIRLFLAEHDDDPAFHSCNPSNEALQGRANSGDAAAAWALCKRHFSGHCGNDSDMSAALAAARQAVDLGQSGAVHAVLSFLADTIEEESRSADSSDDDADSVDASGVRVLALRTASLHAGIQAACPLAHYLMGELLGTPTDVSTQHLQQLPQAKQHFQMALEGGVQAAAARLQVLAANHK